MTGFSAIPLAYEEGSDPNATRKFRGAPRILGPRWANLPTLTVGLLGVQIFWSVEMSYGWSSLGLEGTALTFHSVAISAVSRSKQVQHGYRVCGRTTLRTHHAAANRYSNSLVPTTTISTLFHGRCGKSQNRMKKTIMHHVKEMKTCDETVGTSQSMKLFAGLLITLTDITEIIRLKVA